MPATHRPSTSVEGARIRVPKLAVRHRISVDATDAQQQTKTEPSNDNAVRTPPSSRSSESTSPAPIRRSSDQSRSSQGSQESLKATENSHGRQKAQTANAKVKKKKAGLLGFLTLKEPSTSAWEQYAEAQKQTAAQRPGRKTAVGLPGVSSQKLPDSVPSTNSKWDGLPENASKRTSIEAYKSSSKRFSIGSTKTISRSKLSSHSDETIRKYGSMTSKPPRRSAEVPAHLKRPSTASTISNGDARRPIVYRVAAPVGIHPALRDKDVVPWDEPSAVQAAERPPTASSEEHESPQTFLHPPSPPLLPELSSLLPTPDLDLPDMPRLDDHELSEATTPEPWPHTPSDPQFPPIIRVFVDEHVNEQPIDFDDHSTCWHSDTDDEAQASDVGNERVASETGNEAEASDVGDEVDAGKLAANDARRRPAPNFSRPWTRSTPSPAFRDVPSEPMSDDDTIDQQNVPIASTFEVHNGERTIDDEVPMPLELALGEAGEDQMDTPLKFAFEGEETEHRHDIPALPTFEAEDEYRQDTPLRSTFEHRQDLPLEPTFEDQQELPLEPDFEDEDEVGQDFQPALRDARGRISPFLWEQEARSAFPVSVASMFAPASAPGRQLSTSSRLTSKTVNTATTITAPMHSPTFSFEPTDSTRPSTANTEVSKAAAYRRSSSLSPSRSISDTASIAHSIAPSVAPSVMSAQWNMTPKERLGLGGRVIRKAMDDVPWETDEALLGDARSKRLSVATQTKDESSKLKRLSMRLARK